MKYLVAVRGVPESIPTVAGQGLLAILIRRLEEVDEMKNFDCGSDLHFLANSGRSGLAGVRQLRAANPGVGLDLHSTRRDGRR